MSKIATNIEQSKALLEAGINPATADLVWKVKKIVFTAKGKTTEWILSSPDANTRDGDIPAWSLSALWDLSKFPLVFTTGEDAPEKIIELLVNDLTLPF